MSGRMMGKVYSTKWMKDDMVVLAAVLDQSSGGLTIVLVAKYWLQKTNDPCLAAE